MSGNDNLRQQVEKAVTKFAKEQMSISPEAVFADIHPQSLVVTLQGIACPAERACAQETSSRVLLEQLYGEVFAAAKLILEVSLENILGRRIKRAKLTADPESGDCVIVVTFLDDTE